MNVWSVLCIAARRWFVTIPMLGLTVIAVGLVPTNAVASYPAITELALDGPAYVNQAVVSGGKVVGTTPTPVNPLTHPSDRSLASAAADLVILETSDPSRRAVGRAGLDPNYDIATSKGGTLMIVSAETTSAAKTIRTLQFVTQRIADDVAARGQSANSNLTQHVSVRVVTAPQLLTLQRSNPLRKDLTIGFLGVCLALVTAVVFDNVARFRRARKQRRGRRDSTLVRDGRALTSM